MCIRDRCNGVDLYSLQKNKSSDFEFYIYNSFSFKRDVISVPFVRDIALSQLPYHILTTKRSS